MKALEDLLDEYEVGTAQFSGPLAAERESYSHCFLMAPAAGLYSALLAHREQGLLFLKALEQEVHSTSSIRHKKLATISSWAFSPADVLALFA